jgi:hypothetical protein
MKITPTSTQLICADSVAVRNIALTRFTPQS